MAVTDRACWARRGAGFLILFAIVLTSACGGGAAQPLVRTIALLPVENLTGDPNLDWVSNALPTMLAGSLAGVGNLAPRVVAGTGEAYLAGATEIVHAYTDLRAGGVHFELSLEDAATHRMLQTASYLESATSDGLQVPGIDPGPAAGMLRVAADFTRRIHPEAREFATANAGALAAWGMQYFNQAVTLDPDFGPAWLALARAQIDSGQAEGAQRTISTALNRPSLRTATDRGRLRLLEATLRSDPEAQNQALAAMVELLPNDVDLVTAMAQRANATHQFADAARLYEKLTEIQPFNKLWFNFLGYARYYAGDLAGARRAFMQYGEDPIHRANALDSEGEVLFMAGEFEEAEEYLLGSNDADPNLIEGAGLLKAAYARWLGGDLEGADELFERYVADRSIRGDPVVEWREAVWEYATGREEAAIQRLTEAAQSGDATLAQVARGQLEVLRNSQALPSDLAGLEESYLRAEPAVDGLVRGLYARALLQAGREEEARELVARWPLPETGNNLAGAFVYPIFLEVRQQLGE